MAESAHQCGLALVRLRKDISFYEQKYGDAYYGLHKMFLVMEKQHNRGQDGVGLAAVQFDQPYGSQYIHITRSLGSNALRQVFSDVNVLVEQSKRCKSGEHKLHCGYAAELFIGHLRFATAKQKKERFRHPYHRQSNWKPKNIVVAGNFNLTNFDFLFDKLQNHGLHPVEKTDVAILMERLAMPLEKAVDNLHNELSVLEKEERDHLNVQESTSLAERTNKNIAQEIAQRLNLQDILQQASHDWDGGYVIGAVFGHGDAVVLRDPYGIRPAWYYADDEVIAVASERPPIQTAFNLPSASVKEIPPGHALIIGRDNSLQLVMVNPPMPRASCSFERIYFSCPNDDDIYRERKVLGQHLCGAVLDAINHDLVNTVFTFIPNAGEVSFLGLVQELNRQLQEEAKASLLALGRAPTGEDLDIILGQSIRTEKVVLKDMKLRNFIAEDMERNNDIAHIYDVTYGTVREGRDTLVAVDDSIVRGGTMSHSILRMFHRLHPKRVVLVSSAPQIRYPDCYGIDMGHLGDLIAFRATVALLFDRDQGDLLRQVHDECVEQDERDLPDGERINVLRKLYAPFTAEEISEKIAELMRPVGTEMELHVVYQRVEAVHAACPNHIGDWYFTGNYPTPGGARICNRAYMAWYDAHGTLSPQQMQSIRQRGLKN
eukprot:GGOE01002195.1.p1 GENE.GGOE01002195.1~~GGOE01002195.1.p1  ORF type:complete len:679 (-),score=243.25 GGOE01002195.1:318-2294(-)